jgi:hypothetical protein
MDLQIIGIVSKNFIEMFVNQLDQFLGREVQVHGYAEVQQLTAVIELILDCEE